MQRSQLKRDFAPAQVTRLLTALGADYHWDANRPDDPIISQTICHNPPHTGSYKLYYYPDSQRFHCYTHCGDNFDIYELVQRARGCGFAEALQFIQVMLQLTTQNKVGFTPVDQPNEEHDLLDRYCKMRRRSNTPANYPCISDSWLDFFSKGYPKPWLDEWITPDAIDVYKIRYDSSNNEIIIPHFDIAGQLVGIRSRSYNPRRIAEGNKYMPTMLDRDFDFRHTLRNHLYGLDKVKDTVKRTGKIMLCESEKSALQAWSYYGHDSFTVAVCGSNVSNIQRDLALGLGVKEVFIAFDKEYTTAYTEQSDLYADKLLRIAGMFTPYCTTYCLWDVDGLLGYKDSPTDRGKDVLEQLMKTKYEVETEHDK